MKLSISDLKAADYNPRYISEHSQNLLKKSINTFGDLSGVVFNAKTKTLISGHQRLNSIKDAKTKVILEDYTDELGTVQLGYIIAKHDKTTIKIPLRIVKWDAKKEKKANIAANAHGGTFDNEKLGSLLAELQDETFDIELIGISEREIKSLINFARVQEKIHEAGSDDEFESFTDVPDSSKPKPVICPKCKHRFRKA